MIKIILRTIKVNKEALKLRRNHAFVKEKHIVNAAKLKVWRDETAKEFSKLIENSPTFFTEDLAEVASQMQEQFDFWIEQALEYKK